MAPRRRSLVELVETMAPRSGEFGAQLQVGSGLELLGEREHLHRLGSLRTARPAATTLAKAEARRSTSANSPSAIPPGRLVGHRLELVRTGWVGHPGDDLRELGAAPTRLELPGGRPAWGRHTPRRAARRAGTDSPPASQRESRPDVGERLQSLGVGESQDAVRDLGIGAVVRSTHQKRRRAIGRLADSAGSVPPTIDSRTSAPGRAGRW